MLNLKEVIDFAEEIQQDLLNDKQKKQWQGKDLWWFLGLLVKDIRLLDSELSANKDVNISKRAASIAAYALILSNLQKSKKK